MTTTKQRAALVAGSVLLLATACAPSVAELRDRPVDATYASPSSASAVVQCVRQDLDRQSGITNGLAYLLTATEQDGDTVSLTARYDAKYPVFVVSARPDGTGSTVDVRAWATWPGRIAPVVERCATGGTK
jgi:hypothetical protein